MNDVQDPEIAVTANGHVYVTYDATVHQGNRTHDVLLYNKSTDCGATFSPAQLLTTFNRFTYVDRSAATPEPAQVGAEDDVGEDETDAPAGTRRDCGDFTEACASGYTYPRVDASPRATADQYADPSDETIYVVFEQNIPGTEASTGTTFGTSEPGIGGQGGVYFMRLNGANGNKTTPKLIDPTDRNTGQGHQFWADVSADGGILHFIWYDSRNDPCYSPTRPVGNCANHSVVPSLDVYASRSIDGRHHDRTRPRASRMSARTQTSSSSPGARCRSSATTSGSARSATHPSGRGPTTAIPSPATIYAKPTTSDTDPGADVLQCRTELSDGSITGDTCPRDGGLDQNIYGDKTP